MRVHLSGCQVFPEFEAIHFPSPRSRQQQPQSPPPRSGQIPPGGCVSEEPVVAPPSPPLPPTLPALEQGVEEGGLLGQWWGERSAEWTCHEVYVHTHARKYARTHARRRHRRTDTHTRTHPHSHTQELVREARALRVQLLSEAQDRRATVRRIEVLSCTRLGNCNICAAYADASHCAPRRIA